MEIIKAIIELSQEYYRESWYHSIGKGEKDNEECIYLYVKNNVKKVNKMFESGWKGYVVVVRYVGSVKPA